MIALVRLEVGAATIHQPEKTYLSTRRVWPDSRGGTD